MILLVVEFGADSPIPVFTTVHRIMNHLNAKVAVLGFQDTRNCDYREVMLTLPEATDGLISGEFASVMVSSTLKGYNTTAFIYRPGFDDDTPQFWYGVIDAASLQIFREVRSCTGLRFASLAVEDTLDLENISVINKQTFPWEHWRLVEAVVADFENDITKEQPRRGSAYKEASRATDFQ